MEIMRSWKTTPDYKLPKNITAEKILPEFCCQRYLVYKFANTFHSFLY